jgi:hypothetical protein
MLLVPMAFDDATLLDRGDRIRRKLNPFGSRVRKAPRR